MTATESLYQERWSQLWLRLGASEAPSIAHLVSAYQSRTRHYHNLHHIEQCLAELETLRGICRQPDAIELAIWFHDVVYDAARADNEERSAQAAAEMMRKGHVDPATIDRVTSLIIATKHAAAPPQRDEQIIVDVDLLILGKSPAEFDAYEQAIRKEYAHVDEQSFRAGRAAILQKFLDRPTIYTTRVMREKYENAARANLQRSINQLTGVPSR